MLHDLPDLDCVFLALPHGQAMEIVPKLPSNVKVIDLSGDFRLTRLGSLRETLWPRTQRDEGAVRVCLRPD